MNESPNSPPSSETVLPPSPPAPVPAAPPRNPVYGAIRIIVVTIAGVATIIAGIFMLFLPGPGWLTIYAGIGILALEFAWAMHLFRAIRTQAKRFWDWLTKKRDQSA